MLRGIRRHLAWKLILSYLIVILVGVVVLATTIELAVPRSFDRHLAAMNSIMSQAMGNSSTTMDLDEDLFTNFRAAVTESLFLAASAAFLVVIIVSVLVSRSIVSPVREMMLASQRIAEGHYIERVGVPGGPSPHEMDELAQLAVSFNRMAEKLDKTESMRRQLIGDVAHELRTPLATIKGSMEGLIDGVLPTGTETFQQVYQEADRLEHLVHDLQELSRVEAAAYDLNLRSLKIIEMIEAVRARLGNQFEEKDVQLEITIPARLQNVSADEDRMGQVLLNLVGNALQYTPSEGRVQIRAWRDKNEVFVSVTDTGIGIPKEHLPHIFTRFYRVDKSRSRAGGGSGIGLTIAKHIVEAHGGRIWAESPGSGHGSTFTFTLNIA